MYMVSALSATVGNMTRKKGSQPIEYLDEPLPLTTAEVEEREIRKTQERERVLIERMTQYANSGTVQTK